MAQMAILSLASGSFVYAVFPIQNNLSLPYSFTRIISTCLSGLSLDVTIPEKLFLTLSNQVKCCLCMFSQSSLLFIYLFKTFTGCLLLAKSCSGRGNPAVNKQVTGLCRAYILLGRDRPKTKTQTNKRKNTQCHIELSSKKNKVIVGRCQFT